MVFSDIEAKFGHATAKTMAVACAEDAATLEAVVAAKEKYGINAYLVGDAEKTKRAAAEAGLNISGAELVDAATSAEAAQKSVRLVSGGQAQVLMKGLIHSAALMHAVLNKEWGLNKGRLVSHIGLIESPQLGRMVFVTDAGMNIAPDLKQKVEIVRNAVGFARSLGVDKPRVACIGAMEDVNPAMQATLDAAALTVMCQRGQIRDCVIDGPLGLDNALFAAAGAKKKVTSATDVVGNADIVLVPVIEVGNAIMKTARMLAGCPTGGVLVGAAVPIALTSRADSAESKLRSIVCAMAASEN